MFALLIRLWVLWKFVTKATMTLLLLAIVGAVICFDPTSRVVRIGDDKTVLLLGRVSQVDPTAGRFEIADPTGSLWFTSRRDLPAPGTIMVLYGSKLPVSAGVPCAGNFTAPGGSEPENSWFVGPDRVSRGSKPYGD